ncbi:hypothetical protein [Sphingomonas spermidinifaciens]|uniref:hypothetical protein n=1 Tax=Sphingomonas spermidinifaciens TaxID=1141889 RepID=UPI001141792A|nr:hypothetical protein [Sphingomonas spermidinifaciens]
MKARLLAMLLEQDSFFTDFGLKRDFEQAFGEPNSQEYSTTLAALKANDTIIAFDVEADGLDGVILDHPDHGQIDLKECSPITVDTFFAIGPSFAVEMHQDLYSVSEAAADGGLSEALRLIKLLPIDSSKWTGEHRALRFTPQVQSKLLLILERARAEVAQLQLSNAEAARVAAYVESAQLLAELPDPEPDLIRLLVQRILLIVGVVGFAGDLKGLLWTN